MVQDFGWEQQQMNLLCDISIINCLQPIEYKHSTNYEHKLKNTSDMQSEMIHQVNSCNDFRFFWSYLPLANLATMIWINATSRVVFKTPVDNLLG